VLQHPDAHPITLSIILVKKYGVDWLLWETETLAWRLDTDFAQKPSDMCLHKINAMRTLYRVDSFWKKWEVFQVCCAALNGTPPDFLTMQVPSAAEALIAADIAKETQQHEWSDEVKHYLDAVFKHDGVFVGIEPLAFVDVDDAANYSVDVVNIRAAWPDVLRLGRPPTAETVNAEQLRRMFYAHEMLVHDRAVRAAQRKVADDV
jgi:hypothetical protein